MDKLLLRNKKRVPKTANLAPLAASAQGASARAATDAAAKKTAKSAAAGVEGDAPTFNEYLVTVNAEHRACGGDVPKQLRGAMQAFSSSFARSHRKKMLRKYFMAYDVGNSGCISKQYVNKSRCARAAALLLPLLPPSQPTLLLTHLASLRYWKQCVGNVEAEGFLDFDARDKALLADYFFPLPHTLVDYEMLLKVICERDVGGAVELRERALKQKIPGAIDAFDP